MKTIKFKYVLGSIMCGLISLQTVCDTERYGYALPISFIILFLLSVVCGCVDRYTHAVTDSKGKVIKKFDDEAKALEFADNQERNVKVLMLHIQ